MICRKIFLKRKNRRYNNLIDLLERFSNIDEKKKASKNQQKYGCQSVDYTICDFALIFSNSIPIDSNL